MKKKENLLILAITLLGAYFRFYKLDWGEGFFFHPDEYHIASAVDRLIFPFKMNPQLFSYGSFTVYLIFFVKLLFSTFFSSFADISPFLVGRALSAVFSTFSIPLVYLISKKVMDTKYALLCSFLSAISPGLVQQAHFTTPESTLIFWFLLTVYLWLKYIDTKKILFLYVSAITFGIATGVKIVTLYLLPLLVLVPFYQFAKKPNFAKVFLNILVSLILSFLSYTIVFPYSILDFENFINSINYETAVGRGTQIVFYTRQFIETTPVIFQYNKILPFTVGYAVLIFGTIGFLIVAASLLSKLATKGFLKSKVNLYWTVIIVVFLNIFLFNSFLHAKWTRFIAPTFPFFIIFSVYLISRLSKTKKIASIATLFLVIPSVLWFLMFFSIYTSPDSRIETTKWINDNIPPNSVLLTESGNMLEVPLFGSYQTTKVDFYGIENNIYATRNLPMQLFHSDYFIVQSRRIFANHQRLPEEFPFTANFYNQLFSGSLGYTLIKEIDTFPKLEIGNWEFEIRDEASEETWSVFDHPVLRIYKNTHNLSKLDYERILKI